jgi:hypothetical protein
MIFITHFLKSNSVSAKERHRIHISRIPSLWPHLTEAMKQSSYWTVKKYLVNQQTPRILLNPKLHYRVRIPPKVHILSQVNPFRTSPTYFRGIHTNNAVVYKPLFPAGFPTKNLCIMPHTRIISRSFIDSFIDSLRWVQSMELFIVQLNWTFKWCNVFRFKIKFLSEFAKFRKSNISFIMSVCLPVCSSAWNNSATTGRIFMKFDIWALLENMSIVFKFHYNLTRKLATALTDLCIYHNISLISS